MLVHLTKVSTNRKVGPIPVSTSSSETCPPSCPLSEGGCYAKGGPLAMHWAKVTSGERGLQWADFLREIKSLPKGQLWRHNQAGDLAGKGGRIDGRKLSDLAKANKGRRGFTYTHKPITPSNLAKLKSAAGLGFVVNLSANNPLHADQLSAHGLPVVTVLPSDAPKVSQTPKGLKVIRCPATNKGDVTCSRCGLCAEGARDYVIGFPAHGSASKKANIIARG